MRNKQINSQIQIKCFILVHIPQIIAICVGVITFMHPDFIYKHLIKPLGIDERKTFKLFY